MQVRAFLMLRDVAGEWSIGVHRDLATLLAEWKDRPDPECATGVLHLGFERPPTRVFEVVARAHPGRLLLTAAARFGLPPGFEGSTMAVAVADGMPVHLGTRGWGYTVEEPAPVPEDRQSERRSFQGWLKDFVARSPADGDALAEAAVFTEDDYLAHEVRLDVALRRQLGCFRHDALVENTADPCAVARAAPPWLAERPFGALGLAVRASNVFAIAGINLVRDLADYTVGELLRMPNFGRKSVTDTCAALHAGLREGPLAPHSTDDVIDTTERTLLDSVRSSLLRHSERERDIIRRRMGLEGPSETLDQIAQTYGLTRERIRQLEAKTLKRLVVQESWDDLLSSKLRRLLHERRVPLPVLGVEAADTWFEGVGEYPQALSYLLTRICDGAVSLVRVDGVHYLAFLDQERWEATVIEARRLLASGAEKRWPADRCRLLVHGLLPEAAAEFREILWEKASGLCNFTAGSDGGPVLASYGRGAEQVVEAVLAASNRPLHYTELAQLASARTGRPIDPRRAHNAASVVGLLLGRGTYGLDQHLLIAPELLEAAGEEAADLLATGTTGRQWHTSEILAALRERGTPGADHMDKYTVDIALQRAGGGKRLGRMIWASTTADAQTEGGRIDLRQAVASVILQAGRPLRATEIRQRLSALRGVNDLFQIHAGDPLIRLAPGLWGLNDRDVIVKRSHQPALLDALAYALRLRGSGVHVSEISLLEVNGVADMPATALFSLATADPRLRHTAGQYLYLEEWGGPRRESLPDAVEGVLRVTQRPLTFDAIVRAVAERIKRPCDRTAVSGCLQALEALHDEERRTWMLPNCEAADNEDDPVLTI